MPKRCKKCKVPLEGFRYKWIAAKLFGIKPSSKDPELCNKCENSESKFVKIYDLIDPREEEAISAIHKRYEYFFNIALELIKLSYDILPDAGKSLKNDVHPHVQRSLLALYTQSFRLLRSVIILCKAGLDTEALIQLRSMLENISYLLYISEKDQYDRLQHYLHSRALSKKIAIDEFIAAFPKQGSILKKEWYDKKYEEAIKYFKARFGEKTSIDDIKRKHALRADIAAQSTEDIFLRKQYQVFHRYASAISHGEDILEFIKPTSDTTKFILLANPTSQLTEFCLAEAMVFIFIVMERMNSLLKIGKDEEIKIMDVKLHAFLKENSKRVLERLEQQNRGGKEV